MNIDSDFRVQGLGRIHGPPGPKTDRSELVRVLKDLLVLVRPGPRFLFFLGPDQNRTARPGTNRFWSINPRGLASYKTLPTTPSVYYPTCIRIRYSEYPFNKCGWYRHRNHDRFCKSIWFWYSHAVRIINFDVSWSILTQMATSMLSHMDFRFIFSLKSVLFKYRIK